MHKESFSACCSGQIAPPLLLHRLIAFTRGKVPPPSRDEISSSRPRCTDGPPLPAPSVNTPLLSLPRVSRERERGTPNLRIFAREDANFPRPVTRSNRGIPSFLPLLLIVPRDVSRDWRYDTVGNGVFFVSLSLSLSFSRIEFNQDPARSRLSFCFEVDVGESRLTGKVGNWRPRKRNNLCFLASIVRYPPPRLIGRGKSKQYHSSVINRLN